MKTLLCERLQIRLPVVQAPIGSAATAALCAAVSEAGGLGSIALSWTEPEQVRARIREVRALTTLSFMANLVLDWPQEERLEICLDEGVPVIGFFWGDPSPYIERIHAAGAKVVCQVGDPAEARAAAESGVDAVIAQGWEAGGHVRGQIGTLALVPAVVDAVSPVPVIAAGGIADGRGMAAALVLGAAGVALGTRFLASNESGAHPSHKQRIVESQATDTVHTTLFDIGWPNAPHRVLRTATVATWEAAGKPSPGNRPGEGDTTAFLEGSPIPRYSMGMPRPAMQGDLEGVAWYAGQSCGLVKTIEPAAEIVRRIVAEAETILRQTSSMVSSGE